MESERAATSLYRQQRLQTATTCSEALEKVTYTNKRTDAHTYQFFDHLHDGIASALGLVLVPCDLYYIAVFSAISFLLGELDLNTEVLADLVDHCSLLPNDLGVVFRVHTNNFLVAAQLLCRRRGEERGGEGKKYQS